jgi:hypothetical protein
MRTGEKFSGVNDMLAGRIYKPHPLPFPLKGKGAANSGKAKASEAIRM